MFGRAHNVRFRKRKERRRKKQRSPQPLESWPSPLLLPLLFHWLQIHFYGTSFLQPADEEDEERLSAAVQGKTNFQTDLGAQKSRAGETGSGERGHKTEEEKREPLWRARFLSSSFFPWKQKRDLLLRRIA